MQMFYFPAKQLQLICNSQFEKAWTEMIEKLFSKAEKSQKFKV